MVFDIVTVFLAILGLGILICIHELGHYWMAQKVGMKIDVFSIGFGTPIYSFKSKKTKWQIGWLPFGGYVKIAGMQREGSREPYEIKNGFFGKSPLKRMLVSFMGPFVNMVFAFVAFCAIWLVGGREKPFAEFTNTIGFVDPQSELYHEGIRPGDRFFSLKGKKTEGFKDLIYISALEDKTALLKGEKIDYYLDKKEPFQLSLKKYPDTRLKGLSTIGILSPAQLFIYGCCPLKESSPMLNSGIKNGDRIVWADGEWIFSLEQMSRLINQNTAYLTILRNGTILHEKIQKIKLEDIHISPVESAEIDDWQYEEGLSKKIDELYYFPYRISEEGIVEGSFAFFDEELAKKTPMPLKSQDKILAVDGKKVTSAREILRQLQERSVLLIVQNPLPKITYDTVDKIFEEGLLDLRSVIDSIGVAPLESKEFRLLNPITPKKLSDISEDVTYEKELLKIKDAAKRQEAFIQYQESLKKLYLGIALQDLPVSYNPNPMFLMGKSFAEMGKVLNSLLTGSLHPKWMAGPIGIVEMVHRSWSLGWKEAFFWLGLISLNLAVLNLLPIPVLDGGYILLSLFELITRKKLKAKTMERLVIPFVVLLILFFLFITYNDLARIIGRFFSH